MLSYRAYQTSNVAHAPDADYGHRTESFYCVWCYLTVHIKQVMLPMRLMLIMAIEQKASIVCDAILPCISNK